MLDQKNANSETALDPRNPISKQSNFEKTEAKSIRTQSKKTETLTQPAATISPPGRQARSGMLLHLLTKRLTSCSGIPKSVFTKPPLAHSCLRTRPLATNRYAFIFAPWGAPAPQTPRVGGLPPPKPPARDFGERQPLNLGSLGGGSTPRSEKQY